MDRFSCPSCGCAYNGKRCRKCGYEHFSQEVRHGSHTHRVETPVIDSPKPTRQKAPIGRKKKARTKHPLIRFLILLFLIDSLMPLLRNWGLRLEATENRSAAMITVQPEPILLPENMVIFHQEAGVTIFTTPEQLTHPDNFCLYVHNERSMSVTVSASEIQVNGIAMPHTGLVCKARPGEIGKGWLEPDAIEWETAGIQQVHSLSFDLAVLQNSRLLFTTEAICLPA